jgi:hypothetical protein
MNSTAILEPFRGFRARFPVIKNREFVSTSREILVGEIGLEAAVIQSSLLMVCLFEGYADT